MSNLSWRDDIGPHPSAAWWRPPTATGRMRWNTNSSYGDTTLEQEWEQLWGNELGESVITEWIAVPSVVDGR